MVEEGLHGIDGQTTAIARRKMQESPVSGLYSKCVLQVRQDNSGVLAMCGGVSSVHNKKDIIDIIPD